MRIGAQASRAAASPVELEVQFASLAEAQAAGFTFVDVRDSRERADEPLPSPALHLPMSKLLTDAASSRHSTGATCSSAPRASAAPPRPTCFARRGFASAVRFVVASRD